MKIFQQPEIKFPYFVHTQGFTLIELLVSIGILTTISTIALSVLVTVLRGAKKADIILQVKQNGNFALSEMIDNIRFAKSLDSPTSCIPSLTLKPPELTVTSLSDGGQTTYACTNGTISSNSASLLDTNAVMVNACSFICSQPTAGDPPTITIKFTLQSKTQSNFFESNATIPFESAVTLRNEQ